MNKHIKRLFVFCVIIILAIMLELPVYVCASNNPAGCPHIDVTSTQINQSTCDINGTVHEICTQCGSITLVIKEPKLEHEMTDFVVIVPAGPNTNGEQESHCELCGYQVVKEYICPHSHYYRKAAVLTDCETDGLINAICAECGTIIKSYSYPAWGHSYGDWHITNYATPFKAGSQSRACTVCGFSDYDTYTISMAKNSLYIPGVFNAKIVPCAFTQANCDAYDMIYSSEYWGVGPWIIGHNYRTMGNLPKTRVGQEIYVSIGGNIRTYKVFVSERGTQNSTQSDIKCNSSGYSIFDNFGCETLRMYTCYGGNNGRWVVFAKRVS